LPHCNMYLQSEQPVDFTELFISDALIQNIIDQTNLYADQCIQAMDDTSKHARCHAWKPVTVSEMKTFMGLLFLTGIIHKPELEMYWCTDDMLATPYFNKVMPRNRFEIIWRFLHFSDNTTRPDNCTDRLYKIRPVLDHLVSKFREMYQVYNPQEPIKYGVKSYILCDSDTGYCFNMKPYCGESATLGDTVVSLLDRLAGHGYRLFMDNLYNSVRLCECLLDVKTHVCGTIRKNRGEPPVIRDVRNADLRIGETIMRHNENVMVSVCSTIHAAYTGDNVQRRAKTQNGWRTKSFPCPAPVTAYNQHMGGVDLSDQLLQYYSTQHKTMKWYRKLFLHFLDIAATNAFIVHKELYGTMTHKEFMEELIAELCGVHYAAHYAGLCLLRCKSQ
uniref:PiggyBac transposable element-derived protein domain-containing protein n=1 Tax=Cyprinus carpio carpio TaxID=630221 RepID=A0A9J7X5K1_CYPCA